MTEGNGNECPMTKWQTDRDGCICESLHPVGMYLRDVPPRTGARRNAHRRAARILVGRQRFADAPSRAGFTLIEILATLAIIMLLASLILAGLGGMANKARKAKARVQVSHIAAAWTQYLQDYKHFPTPGGAELTEVNAATLDIFRGGNPKNIVYLDFRGSTTNYCDPWKDPRVPYRFLLDYDLDNHVGGGATGLEELRLSVAVWSVGPDRISGTEDDITSWK